jgi:hypothetical protein
VTADNQIYEQPKFEKTAYNPSAEMFQPVKALSVVDHFEVDEIPLARLPEVGRIAQQQIWIEGGEVKKIEIAGKPTNWSATVAGDRSEITHRLNVREDLITVFDPDNYERYPAINALSPDEMRQRMERIKRDFGGKLKMLNVMINETSIQFTAQDPQKPDEFNEHHYSVNGEKRKPRAVRDSEILSLVKDAREANAKVQSVEDLLFTTADIDFGSLPETARKSLDELIMEKSRISFIAVRRGEYFKYDGGDLICHISVDADDRRRSGNARYSVDGKLLKADKR